MGIRFCGCQGCGGEEGELGMYWKVVQRTRVDSVDYDMQGMVIDAKTLEIHYNGRYEDMAGTYGAPWYLLHRVDLHNGIRDLAVQKHKLPLHLSTQVVDADCETGTITFADGTTTQKDLIIAADGIHVRYLSELAVR